MTESSSQNPSSPKITPKEEPVTLDKPESPNPFLSAIHVEFTFDKISFTTNSEVALLYPSHPNQEYFKDVSDFIYKFCLKKAFTRAPTQYKEYLSEFCDSGANEKSRANDISLKVKLEDLSKILKDTRSAFFTLDSLLDEPIIVSDESEEEEEVAKDKDTEATSHDVPIDTSVPPLTSPKSAQIQELMAQVHLLKFATMAENASRASSTNVPSAGKATASPAEGEKNTKDAGHQDIKMEFS
ncbi:hypothetical protein Tco_0307290 [Tanacetum coccineum]